jgi:hypothetical protein
MQISYDDHLAYWQEVIRQEDLNARNVRKAIIRTLGIKISNTHDLKIVEAKVAGLTRCAIEVQNALKWYETQLQSGDATSPSTAVENNRHARFLAKSEALWRSMIAEANAFDKQLAPIEEHIKFLNWKFQNHPLTHRETGGKKGENQ